MNTYFQIDIICSLKFLITNFFYYKKIIQHIKYSIDNNNDSDKYDNNSHKYQT